MLHNLIHGLGLFLFVLGLFFIVSSVVGIIRLKDVYTKAHAAGIADSCGIPIMLIGIYLTNYQVVSIMKIIALIALIYILGPTSTYMLLRSSFNNRKDVELTRKIYTNYDNNS